MDSGFWIQYRNLLVVESTILPKFAFMKKWVVQILTILVFGIAGAQNPHLLKANKYFESRAWFEAIPHYEKALKDPQLPAQDRYDALSHLADCWLNNHNSEKAEPLLKEAAKLQPPTPKLFFRLGDVCRMNGKYQEAWSFYVQALGDPQLQVRAKKFMDLCLHVKDKMSDSIQYSINPLPFNTRYSEICPVQAPEGCYFVSDRKRGSLTRNSNQATGELFYDIYLAPPGAALKPQLTKPVKQLNSKYHDGPLCLSANFQSLMITRSAAVVKGQDAKANNKLEIASSMKMGTAWTKPTRIAVPPLGIAAAHPALSADGNVLVFASDMEGGMGGSDIYICRKNEQGWSEPENAGPAINSMGNEMFPFISSDGWLAFSSDGWESFGGLDIYFARPFQDSWAEPTNAGYPLNSQGDDFGISFNKGKPNGMFTSDRKGGNPSTSSGTMGGDDLYQFTRKIPVNISVWDAISQKPLAGATVVILDANGKNTLYTADENGHVKFFGDMGRGFQVTATQAGYEQQKQMESMDNVSPLGQVQLSLSLNPDDKIQVALRVLDSETKGPIPSFNVRLVPLPGSEQVFKGENGKIKMVVKPDVKYTLLVTAGGFKPGIIEVSTERKKPGEVITLDASLQRGKFVLVDGLVTDAITRKPMESVVINGVRRGDSLPEVQIASRVDGQFWLVLSPDQDYQVLGTKEGFYSLPVELNRPGSILNPKVKVDMFHFVPGQFTATVYYDYKKADVKTEEAIQLVEIIRFLSANPNAKAEIASYTDSRGGTDFNLKLSQARAEALATFLASAAGIDKGRITAKGFGEASPVNKCQDGVPCKEEENARNRRAVVTVY